MRKYSRTYLALHLLLIIAMIVGAYAIAIPNYEECRAHGFSRMYCTFTHLVR